MATPRCIQKPITNKLNIMLRKILPYLMRQEIAKPFLRQVDYIAYELPDYPKVIKHPIDLSTIKHRLVRKYYTSFHVCMQDFNLMLENCFIYNSPEDPIIDMGIRLNQYLSSKLNIMPSTEFKVVKAANNYYVPYKKFRNVKGNFKSDDLTKQSSNLEHKKSRVKKAISVAVGDFESLPNIMSDVEFEKCTILINELMSPKYKSMHYLFLKPVDAEGLGLVDYHEFVKYPMDLSTIKMYLEARLYETRTAFINDIYLILYNCTLYNGVETDIGIVCRRFQGDFENLYSSIFKERCKENINDEAFYILMKIKWRHKELEETIRLNTEKISIARQRIVMIVNMFEDRKAERKRKMLIKHPHYYIAPKSNRNSDKKMKSFLKKSSFKMKSDVY